MELMLAHLPLSAFNRWILIHTCWGCGGENATWWILIKCVESWSWSVVVWMQKMMTWLVYYYGGWVIGLGPAFTQYGSSIYSKRLSCIPTLKINLLSLHGLYLKFFTAPTHGSLQDRKIWFQTKFPVTDTSGFLHLLFYSKTKRLFYLCSDIFWNMTAK